MTPRSPAGRGFTVLAVVLVVAVLSVLLAMMAPLGARPCRRRRTR